MEKGMRTICAAFGLLIAVSSTANAAITIVDVDVVNSSSGQLDTHFLPPSISASESPSSPYYRFADEDWGWTHSFSPLSASINWATLEIEAFDVDPGEWDLIDLDGVGLGRLDFANNAWGTTALDLNSDALAHLIDGKAVISMDIDWLHDSPTFAVTLGQSTLTATYEPIPNPAPGALVLGSIGASFVAWLRRRRTL